MKYALQVLKRLKSDENGASLIEYTLLLALISVALITAITAMATWMSTEWNGLLKAVQ